MSAYLPVTVGCPRCGADFETEIAVGLDAERMPEARHAVLDDRFQRMICPRCTHPVSVEPSLVYTDFERRQWVVALPRAAHRHHRALGERVAAQFDHHMRVACPPVVQGWADDFTVRLVFGLDALREKLVVWDAGLDDRVVEALKWDLARRGGGVAPTLGLWVRGIDAQTLHLWRVAGPEATRAAVLAVDRARYAAIEVERGAWAAALPAVFDGIVVDWRAPLWPDEPLAADAGLPAWVR